MRLHVANLVNPANVLSRSLQHFLSVFTTKRSCCHAASFRHAGDFRLEVALQLPYPLNPEPEDRTREMVTILVAQVLESFSSFVEQCFGGHGGSRASQAELASSAAIPRPILSLHSLGGGCLSGKDNAHMASFPLWCTAACTVRGKGRQSGHGTIRRTMTATIFREAYQHRSDECLIAGLLTGLRQVC